MIFALNMFLSYFSREDYYFLNLSTLSGSFSCLESIALIQTQLPKKHRERHLLPQPGTNSSCLEELEAGLL